jgi:hypothetical protein
MTHWCGTNDSTRTVRTLPLCVLGFAVRTWSRPVASMMDGLGG